MRVIDTHCHVNEAVYDHDRAEVLQRAMADEVVMVNVGDNMPSSAVVAELAEKWPGNCWAVVGVHPGEVKPETVIDELIDVEKLRQLSGRRGVVAIGECGLDYFRLPDDIEQAEVVKAKQLDLLERQLDLAVELEKPVVFHCRAKSADDELAYDDLISVLKQRVSRGEVIKFEVHSFTGSLAVAQQFLELGGYLGVNGIVTFDKSGRSAEVMAQIPLDKILLETDAPYLAPVPHRGQRNEPVWVKHVGEWLANLRKVNESEVFLQTTKNAEEFFGLAVKLAEK